MEEQMLLEVKRVGVQQQIIGHTMSKGSRTNRDIKGWVENITCITEAMQQLQREKIYVLLQAGYKKRK